MTMNFLVVVIISVSCLCDALPNCCFDPAYYSEVLATFSFNLTCSSEHEHAVDNCVSCLTRILRIQHNSAGLNDLNYNKPIMTCQNLVQEQNKVSAQIILTWSVKSVLPVSLSIFILEFRNSTSEEWHFIGMTNQTVAQVNGLEVTSEYQFRVTPFATPDLILSPLISDWILTLGTKAPISSPWNLTVNNFKFDDEAVEATVEWNPSRENPCSYILYWLSASTDEFYSEKTINLPNDNLSTVLSNLSFQTKYTLKLAALDLTGSRKVTYAEASFVTPSCLTLTHGNFTMCAPGSPLNITSFYIPECKIVLTWLPPKYASSENRISGYQISVIEASEKNHIILRYKESFSVDKDVLNVTISDLKSSILYFFQVRAVSNIGVGPPAMTQFGMEELGASYQPMEYVPWHYILPSVAFALVVIVAAVICRLCRTKRKLSKSRDFDQTLSPQRTSSWNCVEDSSTLHTKFHFSHSNP